MPLNPGNDTVTFHYPGVVQDRLHNITALAPADTVQGGCSVQPVSVHDKISDTAYSSATDICLAPSNAFTQTVKAEWFIYFIPTGTTQLTYRVLGTKPWRDLTGAPDHITFVCRQEMG